ncbi:MAG: AraC family transcriptional regulator [Chryseolinea sp.]
MMYHQFLPHPALSKYIDAYWVVRNDDAVPHATRILPDGCVDIIVNIGEEFIDEDRSTIKHGCAFLVGTMTHYIDTTNSPGTHLIGIRFKPLGFSAFYKFASLHEIANMAVALEKEFIPAVHQLDANSVNYLDSYFVSRLSKPSHTLSHLVDHITRHHGNIAVDSLSRQYAMSPRKLERSFKQHLGVSPKEFINFKRYQYAMTLIRQRRSRTSLLDIALDCGYYDHSHLTNEIRKYSGLTPSAL